MKNKTYPLLDHGFIKIIDFMGDDKAIVQSARVSYGDGTKTVNEDKGLINYLIKHQHTSPLEMCEIKLHIKLPIFIARQWIRHRTANVNEISARYSVLPNEFYVPEINQIKPQSKTNKQCRAGEIDVEKSIEIQEKIKEHSINSYGLYTELLGNEEEEGLARELSRTVLPVNFYTEFYWKIDLHNLLHFIKLRIHPHAQYEIRVYAEVLLEIVKEWCPFVFEAFQEHILHAKKLSRSQIECIKFLLDNTKINEKDKEDIKNHGAESLSKRELQELKEIFNI